VPLKGLLVVRVEGGEDGFPPAGGEVQADTQTLDCLVHRVLELNREGLGRSDRAADLAFPVQDPQRDRPERGGRRQPGIALPQTFPGLSHAGGHVEAKR